MGDAGGSGHDVLALPMDSLLCLRDRWRLVVIDCEGAEFACLFTSKELSRVGEIAGEYHERADTKPYADIGQPCTAAALAKHLEASGFQVRLDRKGPGMGLFFARRQ